ncbi:hypothetical protein PR002_g31438 [Phytophthora rubi]|uniref:Uncharacterized protein n=1 Tax=Phytophthora rubi TaxID=129364 RepID=A0A6A3GI45_9STRA|nr:hypothetical protein PR002_g31438 [Phytophthora rubi]
MCNGLTKSGKPCQCKADWCSQHLSQKPITAEPVVESIAEDQSAREKKEEDIGLISTEKEIVETTIVPPMSPNANSTPATQLNSTPMGDETKPETEKNISIFKQCKSFLNEKATGEWHETRRFKDRETHDYLHKPMRGMSLLRVEDEVIKKAGGKGHCRFYWIYNMNDAKNFVDHVHLRLRGECHEIIITPRCRFFYDIDLQLDEMEKCDIASAMGFPLEADGDEVKTMDSVSKIRIE